VLDHDPLHGRIPQQRQELATVPVHRQAAFAAGLETAGGHPGLAPELSPETGGAKY
jgi:hypothetical protein